LLSRIEWTTEELGIVLDYEEIKEPGVDGYSSGGRIVVRTSLSPAAKAAVLVHKLSHTQTSNHPQQHAFPKNSFPFIIRRCSSFPHSIVSRLASISVSSLFLKTTIAFLSFFLSIPFHAPS
jgi:hypothetical protein